MSRKVVRYAYKDSRGTAKRGFLAPFALLMYRHGLYAVGASSHEATINTTTWRGSLSVFAVERFTDADHMRERTFEIPFDFKIDDVLHGAFGIHVGDPSKTTRVVVEFSRDKAALVEARLWHPTQSMERISGGGVRLSLCVTNVEPLVSWVLEWGPHARVVEPPTLVSRVVQELDAARRRYAYP